MGDGGDVMGSVTVVVVVGIIHLVWDGGGGASRGGCLRLRVVGVGIAPKKVVVGPAEGKQRVACAGCVSGLIKGGERGGRGRGVHLAWVWIPWLR